jgi:antirestriction protein
MTHEQQPPEEGRKPEQLRPDTPSIWVGSLSDYNNGILHGEWIDAAREPDEIWADINRVLAASPTMAQQGDPAEEWAIFDHDGFGGARIGEYDRVEVVAAIARGVAEHGPAFGAWANETEGDLEALARFEDVYLGHYDSAEAYVEQMVDDLGYERLLDEAIPDSLRSYVKFDTAALARDMEIEGDIRSVPADEGGFWLFDGR